MLQSTEPILDLFFNGFKVDFTLNVAQNLYDVINTIAEAEQSSYQKILDQFHLNLSLLLTFIQFKAKLNLELNNTMYQKMKEDLALSMFVQSPDSLMKMIDIPDID